MSYTDQQRQQISSWVSQKVPRLTSEGCPLCASATGGYGVERVTVPGLEVPLMAIACRNCGYVMLFNEQAVLTPAK